MIHRNSSHNQILLILSKMCQSFALHTPPPHSKKTTTKEYQHYSNTEVNKISKSSTAMICDSLAINHCLGYVGWHEVSVRRPKTSLTQV